MSEHLPLFELNPALERDVAREEFAHLGRTQIRDLLTLEAAKTVHQILAQQTPWGVAWRAGDEGPVAWRRGELAQRTPADMTAVMNKLSAAMKAQDYAFLYAQYPILTSYMEKWQEHEGLDLLIEHINAEPMLRLVREVTGISELIKADAQATLFGPGHFLALHEDGHKAEGWRVAYVISFCADDWRPDWGGYLNFYNEEGDIIAGLKPRFNALNLFRVPLKHNVSFVTPFAPAARFSITGWFRDR